MKSRFKVGFHESPIPTLIDVLGRKYPPPSKLLQNIRLRFRLTQAQMARRVGVTEDTWARWERGDQLPHPLMYCGLLALTRVWPVPNLSSRKPKPGGFARRAK